VYDKEMGDVVSIQEEIARTVAANLRITIDNDLGEVSTRNLEACDEYLRAKRGGLGPGTNIPVTLTHLQRAVEINPQFTAAWVMWVQAYSGALVHLPALKQEAC
jgi:hypothetical protein